MVYHWLINSVFFFVIAVISVKVFIVNEACYYGFEILLIHSVLEFEKFWLVSSLTKVNLNNVWFIFGSGFFVSFLLSVEPLFTESLWDEYLTYYHGNEVVPIRKLTKCQLDSDYRSRWLGFLFVCWKSIKPIWVYFKKLLMVFMVCIYGSLWMAIDLIRLPYRSTGRLCMFWE